MTAEEVGRAAAELFRSTHGLGAAPLADLVDLAERTVQVDVAVLNAPAHEHGLTMRDPARDVVIVGIARSDAPLRQRSTIAHEIGHIALGHYDKAPAAGWSDRSPAEMRADVFARHLLVPLAGVRAICSAANASVAEVSELVRWFGASPQIVAIQLHQAGLIDRPTKESWVRLSGPELAVRFGWAPLYQQWQKDSLARRPPRRLLARATAAYGVGLVGVETVARLMGVTAQVAREELAEAGLTPGDVEARWAPMPIATTDDDFDDLDQLEAEESGIPNS